MVVECSGQDSHFKSPYYVRPKQISFACISQIGTSSCVTTATHRKMWSYSSSTAAVTITVNTFGEAVMLDGHFVVIVTLQEMYSAF